MATMTMNKLRWFGDVERKHDNDQVKCCITWEVEGIKTERTPEKTWWDCVKDNMESLGLSQKDEQFRMVWYGILGFNVPLDTV